MIAFLSRRLFQSAILLVLVSAIGFFILHLAPGGPLSQFMSTPGMDAATIVRMKELMGLNLPIPVQYADWLGRLLVGDWGHSYRDGRDVLAVISGHIGATVLLMGTALVLAVSGGVVIGLFAALKQHTLFDYVTSIVAMVALSIPTFWFGLVGIYFFSIRLGWVPVGNMYSIGDGSFLDYLHHLIMPACVLALVSLASWSRYMRTASLEVINQDFVRTAKAKGLEQRVIVTRHILRNALLPMITLIGLQLPSIVGGAVVTETVFTWPGVGRLFLDSLHYKDYPVIMGLLMFSAVLTIVGNLLADIFVAIADPRIRN
ncbi:ABC transporter permease [Mesorhizobium sp.]|uniref:ABC transporter permease n=1 Tax=Mesorhizobium sp. TaxID=1871066 RepID=UPI000FE72B71|nr:ABC transporter permease [Mesorhizobium sp.]RWJ31948.1 MAG: ABC transporter permease [Mesorhizobium sp.]TIQ73846.1 MAG: ABC transporter permease [Mesorhizobium sp.]